MPFPQYPTAVAKELFKLIRRDGLAKISYSLVSVRIKVTPSGRVNILSDEASAWQMNIPQPILKTVMQPYFAYAQNFRGESFYPFPAYALLLTFLT